MIEVGATVLHPRYGVGVIGSIETRFQDGENRNYYVIPKPAICSTIFVPVDTADELGLRPVSSPDKLKHVLEILSGESVDDSIATELRNLIWNDPVALACAIKQRASAPKSRYPKVSEQHQLKRAKKLLTEEITTVLGIPEERVTALVDGCEANCVIAKA